MSTYQFLADEIIEIAAPELQGTVYVVEVEDPERHGYTSRWAMPREEYELKRSGRWKRDGHIIAVCPEQIREDLPEESKHRFGEAMRQILTHEAAHLLPAMPPLTVFPDEELPSEDSVEFCEGLVKATQAKFEAREELPWDGDHGASFIRRCCHLWYRLDQANIKFPLEGLCGGPAYGVAHPIHYLDALESELYAKRNATFEEILRRPPPVEFARQWTEDVDFYHRLKAEYAKPKELRA